MQLTYILTWEVFPCGGWGNNGLGSSWAEEAIGGRRKRLLLYPFFFFLFLWSSKKLITRFESIKLTFSGSVMETKTITLGRSDLPCGLVGGDCSNFQEIRHLILSRLPSTKWSIAGSNGLDSCEENFRNRYCVFGMREKILSSFGLWKP